MDLDDIMLSEISQMQKDTYCVISLICGLLKKKKPKETNKIKQKQTHRNKDRIPDYQRGRGLGCVKGVKGVNHMVMNGN